MDHLFHLLIRAPHQTYNHLQLNALLQCRLHATSLALRALSDLEDDRQSLERRCSRICSSGKPQKQQIKDFAQLYTDSLERLDARWEDVALRWKQVQDDMLSESSGELKYIPIGSAGERCQPLATAVPSWLTELDHFSGKNAELLLKVMAHGFSDLESLATSILSGLKPDQNDPARPSALETKDIEIIFGLVLAVRGSDGAVTLAEQIFIQTLQSGDTFDQKEAVALLMSVLDIIHMADLHVTTNDELSAATFPTTEDPTKPSASLELELLQYLEEARKWQADNLPSDRSDSLGKSLPLALVCGRSNVSHSRSRTPSNVAASLSTISTNAAEVWNAGLHSGMATLNGILTAGNFLGNRFAGHNSHQEEEARQDRDKAASPTESGIVSSTKAGQQKDKAGSSKVPSSLSVSRFVLPSSGLSSTTESHASASSSPPSSPGFERRTMSLRSSDGILFSEPGDLSMASTGSDTVEIQGTMISNVPKNGAKQAVRTALETISSVDPRSALGKSPHRSQGANTMDRQGSFGLSSFYIDSDHPVSGLAHKVMQALLGSPQQEVKAPAVSQTPAVTTPAVLALSRRLFNSHFPAARFPRQNRRLRLIIIVRWYAFSVLRDLITRPETTGRALHGGHLIWGSGRVKLTAIASGSKHMASEKTARPFEDIWTSDESTCRMLNELHRVLYAAIVRTARIAVIEQEGSGKEHGELDAASTKLMAAFGVSAAERGGMPSELKSAFAEVSGVSAFAVTNSEVAVLARLAVPAFLEAASQRVRSNAGSPDRQASKEDADDLFRALDAVRHGTQNWPRDDGRRFAQIYSCVDAGSGKITISQDLSALEERQRKRQPKTPLQTSTPRRRTKRGSSSSSVSGKLRPSASGSGFSVKSSQGDRFLNLNGSGWNSPPCSPFSERSIDDLFELSKRAGSDTPRLSQLSCSTRHDRSVSGLPDGSDDDNVFPLARRLNFDNLPVDEIKQGLFAVMRRGYYNGEERSSVIPALENASQAAWKLQNFADASLFERTIDLLRYCSEAERTLIDSDFAALLDHIIFPLDQAEQERRKQDALARMRLTDLECLRTTLSTKARLLCVRLHELRTRAWYALEIRTSPAVVDALQGTSPSLAEDATSWMTKLGIHDLSLSDEEKSFCRDLDPAFQRIVRDAASFFASPLWGREDVLARPFLARQKGEPKTSKAMYPFGCASNALLRLDESAAGTLVGLEAFLQKVQLTATGLLLSEALRRSPPSSTPLAIGTSQLQHANATLSEKLSSMGSSLLLLRMRLHPSPHHKLRALFNLTRLVVSHLSAPQSSTTAAPRKIQRRPRRALSMYVDDEDETLPPPPLSTPDPPTTDAMLNVLESVLIPHLQVEPHFFFDLQIIAAFSPAAVLDWKDEGKAFCDVVLAASSIRKELNMI